MAIYQEKIIKPTHADLLGVIRTQKPETCYSTPVSPSAAVLKLTSQDRTYFPSLPDMPSDVLNLIMGATSDNMQTALKDALAYVKEFNKRWLLNEIYDFSAAFKDLASISAVCKKLQCYGDVLRCADILEVKYCMAGNEIRRILADPAATVEQRTDDIKKVLSLYQDIELPMGLFEESNGDQENRRQVSTPSMKPALDAMTQCRDMRTLRFDASKGNSSTTNHLKTIVPAQLSKIAASNPELVMYVNAQGYSCTEAEVVAFSIFSIKNQAIVSLNLGNCSITDGLASYLFDEFASNRSVTTLNLNQNYIGDQGAIALAAALTGNTSLKSLDIGENYIGDSGWRALAPVLANNGTLTHANLAGSMKHPSAAAVGSIFAANTTLKALDLTKNRMEDHIGATMIDCLGHNDTLTALNLAYAALEPAALNALAHYIEHTTALKSLDLSGTPRETLFDYASSQGPKDKLKAAVAARHSARISAVVDIIKSNKIETLNLKDIFPYDSDRTGFSSIVDALRDNVSLTKLDFRYNWMCDNEAISLSAAVKEHPSLASLNIDGNVYIFEEGKVALQAASSPKLTIRITKGGVDRPATQFFRTVRHTNAPGPEMNMSGSGAIVRKQH
ncbi:MAG: hypothetical protein JWQ23_1520 [Herminiimonas sp.]|nr:hypothetical protein [Herminiimonas sp.]